MTKVSKILLTINLMCPIIGMGVVILGLSIIPSVLSGILLLLLAEFVLISAILIYLFENDDSLQLFSEYCVVQVVLFLLAFVYLLVRVYNYK